MISIDRKASFRPHHGFQKAEHYFQAHVINVMTDHPLKKAMNKLEAAG